MSATILLRVSLKSLSNPLLSKDDPMDSVLWSSTNIILDILYRGLTRTISSAQIDPEWMVRHAFLLKSVCNSTELAQWSPDRLQRIFDLLLQLAERVDELDPITVERFTSLLVPYGWKAHWDILSKLLTSRIPLRILQIISYVGVPHMGPSSIDMKPPEPFATSKKSFVKTYFETLMHIRMRFSSQSKSEAHWTQIVGSRIVMRLLTGLIDDTLLFLGTLCDDMPCQLLATNPHTGNVYNYHTLWHDKTILPHALRPLLMSKADLFPVREVQETFETWLQSFPSSTLPAEAPAFLFAETFSLFACFCADRMSQSPPVTFNYQLLILQSNHQMLRPRRTTLKAVISSQPPRARSPSFSRAQTMSKKSNRSRRRKSTFHVKLKIKRYRSPSLSLSGPRLEDLWDVSLRQVPLRVILKIGNNTPIEAPICFRGLYYSPGIIIDYLKYLPHRKFSDLHWFFPRIEYCGYRFEAFGFPNWKELALLWTYLLPWLECTVSEEDPTTWSIANTAAPFTASKSQWWHGIGIFEVPCFDIHVLSPETEVSVCLTMDALAYFSPMTAGYVPPPRLYFSSMGKLSLLPCWQTTTVEQLLRNRSGKLPSDQWVPIPGCPMSLMLHVDEEAGQRRCHITGVDFFLRVFTLSSPEERRWLRKACLDPQEGKSRRKRSSRSTNVVSWPPTYMATAIEHLTHVGIGGYKKVATSTDPSARWFGLHSRCSVLGCLALTDVGKDFLVRQLQGVNKARKSLLRNPDVLTRLLGVGVELNGTFDSSSRLLTILGQVFGPIPWPRTVQQHLALILLGDNGLNPQQPIERPLAFDPLTYRKQTNGGLLLEYENSFLKLFRDKLEWIDFNYYSSRDDFESCSSELGGEPANAGTSVWGAHDIISTARSSRECTAHQTVPLTRSIRLNMRHAYSMRRYPSTPWAWQLTAAVASPYSSRLPRISPCSPCLVPRCVNLAKAECPALQFGSQHLKIIQLVGQMHNSVLAKTQGLMAQFERIARESPALFHSVELVWRILKFSEINRFSPELFRPITKLLLGSFTSSEVQLLTTRAERLGLLSTFEYGWNLFLAYDALLENENLRI
eukprot:Gregarina_sp_Poly_1__5015@NODE_265_length_10384_cov_23_891344_g231_i0_p2_GENE_NODE_265_length_10384_cov_23_891344_g231_i0NODE_265_length_10384_cov_23_891344_g231_i0_p2_ORF_typecomplete_len1078_score122_56_NODE_265_length_10384_cov_23_891344_g231_i0711010343